MEQKRRESITCTTQVVKCAYCGGNRTTNFRGYTVGKGHFRIISQHSKRAPSFLYSLHFCQFILIHHTIFACFFVLLLHGCHHQSLCVLLFYFLFCCCKFVTVLCVCFLLSHNNFHSYLLCCGVAFRLRESPTHLPSHLHVLMFSCLFQVRELFNFVKV